MRSQWKLLGCSALLASKLLSEGAVPVVADLRPPEAANSPSIGLVREGGRLKITYTGVLVSAIDPRGPWSPVPQAASPYLTDAIGPGPRFFRSQEPDEESVFGSRSVLEWTLTGPFQPNFDLAFAGLPDGIFPPRREKPYFSGTVALGRFELPASLRVRGNSSLQECPFPKLKLKVSGDDRKGTPFEDAREIKIGTHCAEGGTGTVGRLRDETATYREALAYEVMELLGFVTPRVRRARIEYRDTSPGDPEGAGGWRVVRQALLLEDPDVLAERLGGRALSDDEIAALKNAGFDAQLIADLRFLHALLGNWDFALSTQGEGLWNTDVIARADGSLVPVAGDFDLCSWVTSKVLLSAPHDYHPELGELEREVRFEVGQIRVREGDSAFRAGRERFIQKRAALETLVQEAEVDHDGRANAMRHLSVFFEALAAEGGR